MDMNTVDVDATSIIDFVYVQFKKELESANFDDDETFRKILTKGKALFNLSDKEMARKFGSTPSAVHRWITGEGFPQDKTKPVVYKFFVERTLEKINER
jgi:hypothetical protein